ncbi:Rha family transcriptional regulator [Clostridium sporogenes]
MNNLQVVNNKNLTLDSREVAEMIGKPHDQLMRSIRVYKTYLDSAKMQTHDYFTESTYINSQNKEQPCYLLTKMGCEMVANKMTGKKGVLFTAKYVKRFNQMESTIKQQKKQITSLTKQQETEARLKNAKVREANLYLKIADKIEIPEYKQIMYSKATQVLSGEQLLPLPVTERKSFTAGEIGEKLGISANMVGRLSNKYNLKTNEYGVEVWDKAKNCSKQIPTFRYYENVIPVLSEKICKI